MIAPADLARIGPTQSGSTKLPDAVEHALRDGHLARRLNRLGQPPEGGPSIERYERGTSARPRAGVPDSALTTTEPR
jgi:hypothetical protein